MRTGAPSALGLSRLVEASWRPPLAALRRYLDDIGFHGIYKYLVSARHYHLVPSLFSQKNAAYLERQEHFVTGGAGWALAKCLATRRGCPIGDLTNGEQKAASALAEIGLAHLDNGRLEAGNMQLISAGGNYLLLDAAAHFPLGRVHEIYIGVDTLLLLYYLNPPRKRGLRSLDLCSGTGVIALASALHYDDATATDVFPEALALIRMNRFLNDLDDRVTVLDEDLDVTLAFDQDFDLITCNPPFVAIAPGFERPLYAAGTGADGLDYLRRLVERIPGKLRPGGEGLLVADLPGDETAPYFFGELAEYAERLDVAIDAYVDNRLDGGVQANAMAEFMSHLHPTEDPGAVSQRVKEFIERDLKARYYYLTTIRICRKSESYLRAFNRF